MVEKLQRWSTVPLQSVMRISTAMIFEFAALMLFLQLTISIGVK